MRFRPCIDIHDGKVKQIVGGTLRDTTGDKASGLTAGVPGNPAGGTGLKENFISDRNSEYYASYYKKRGLSGGHVIMLNHRGSDHYDMTREQALAALRAYPGGLMAGGGIDPDNALAFLDAGASHVIVTSYVFKDGRIDMDALSRIVDAVGRERLCLDLSCRKRSDGQYYIVTDRWQRFTETRLDSSVMELLSGYASEFLVHAVDSEGKQQGIDEKILSIIKESPVPVTYAGGVGCLEDVKMIRELGEGKIDITVGSALDIFGGRLALEEILECIS
ncbi:MAG: phosphoribosylformimino-5-aminoimidazole carboxamide ribotide isomerase [Lachnospiraceae bacterium]|nr:phosphoribosylformimino-5-aminoimidazole carboxamide ribotide isomerase [Lachnospiraceae bacterium]